tara:strand:- start:5746 stop:6537 length:792 start_codon:yes stop_codon:yes gene_type:complete
MSDSVLSFLLGLIQGLTEFLPISSSAHLLLPSLLFGLNDLGLSFDIAVHAGTLIAVMYYFRGEILLMSKSFFKNDEYLLIHRNLAFSLIIATIPVVFAGLFLKDIIEQRIFSIEHIAIANIIFAGILLFAYLNKKNKKNLYSITLYSALFIGIFQSLALFPGASRSGTAITAALLIGINLKDASKFSFMLGIPTIFGALILLIFEMQLTSESFNYINLVIGFFVSMILAFLTIKFFLKFVEKIGMLPFVIYRIILGGFILILV